MTTTRAKTIAPVQIDGALCEGGGQILRTSLALSLVTGRAFRVVNIRANRDKPGLLRQHLTAVRAAVQVGDAVCDGAEIGSTELVFRPGTIRPGDHRFAVGTAGSTTLILQTILPALALARSRSSVTLEGGTHNPHAPSYDFLKHSFLPVFCQAGPRVTTFLVRPGFYPAGGGQIEALITPVDGLRPVELLTRGADGARRVVAHYAGLPESVAKRAFEQVDKRLRWGLAACTSVEHPAERGPGFVLVGEVGSEHHTEVFTAFGERGVRAEAVADRLVDQIRPYLMARLPVGEHLADQLLLPLALAGGGGWRTAGLSPHARTNMEVIRQFLPVGFRVETLEGGGVEVRVESAV